MVISTPRLRRLNTASLHSGTMKSQPSLMSSGKREVVQTDHRKKIGSMQRNNCDPASTPVDPASGGHSCPKCGVEMEPIDIAVEGLPLNELQLCPGCYLVTWSDQEGLHARQGVPMKKGLDPRSQPSVRGEPEQC